MNIIPENVSKEIVPSKLPFGCELCDYTGFKFVKKDEGEFRERCDCYKTYQYNLLKIDANIPEIYFNAQFDLDKSVVFNRFKPLRFKMVEEKTSIGITSRRQLLFENPPLEWDINKFGSTYVGNASNYLAVSPRKMSVSLIFSGEVGSGKTYLACAIANEMLKKGYKAYYLKAKQYIDYVMLDSYSKDQAKASELKSKRDFLNGLNKNFQDNCHLLILDELGFEHKGDSGYALAQIKDLLRNRAEKHLPTIITTNFMLDELTKVYEEELVSMFAESYMFFMVICPDDYRLRKSSKLDADFDFEDLSVSSETGGDANE